MFQAGPVQRIQMPKDNSGHPRTYAFIIFKHVCSVPYAKELLDGTPLYERPIHLQFCVDSRMAPNQHFHGGQAPPLPSSNRNDNFRDGRDRHWSQNAFQQRRDYQPQGNWTRNDRLERPPRNWDRRDRSSNNDYRRGPSDRNRR